MAHTLPGWAPALRKHQIPAVNETVDAFRSGNKIVMLDAPPGAGKTLIADVVRQELGLSALYVCTTKTLMNQFRDDFPHSAYLMGRSNYPTLHYPERFGDPFNNLTAEDCDKAENDGECSYCDPSLCPYEQAKKATLSSKLACTNTSYFLSEANYIGRLSGHFPLVIVDEACALDRILMGFIEVNVTKRMRQRLKLPLLQKYSKASTWQRWAEDAVVKLDSEIRKMQGVTDLRAIRQRKAYERLEQSLKFVRDEVGSGGWIRDGEDREEVLFRPLRVTPFVKQNLWRHAPRFLLMSGTFISPEHYAEELDLPPEHTTVEVEVSYPVSQRPVRICGVAPMTYSKQAESWPKTAAAIEKILAMHLSERILIHTVSYQLANFIADYLASPRTVTYTQSSQREAALTEYKSKPDGVLIAASMDRGISLDDDLCRVIIVAKLPYPSLGDKQINQRVHGPGGDIWYKVQTVRTLVQMLGRGMRSETDYVVSYLTDTMFTKLWKDNPELIPEWTREALEWGGGWKKQIIST